MFERGMTLPNDLAHETTVPIVIEILNPQNAVLDLSQCSISSIWFHILC